MKEGVILLENYDYMSIPYDLSGSMAKNRFRNEILWGLKKIYEFHRKPENYVVVFDYACDVEVHLKGSYEFYQIKTQLDNESYKLSKALRKTNGKSILGKLYILKYDKRDNDCNNIKVGLVSNAPLSTGEDEYKRIESLKLLDLKPKVVENVKDKLKEELLKENVTLENAHFIRTGLDLFEPDKTLIGETALFFEDVYGTEPKKVTSLYRVLSSEVSSKACYELEILNYSDLLFKKGIDRGYLEGILSKYTENTDLALDKARSYIKEKYKGKFKERIEKLNSLSKLIVRMKSDKWLQKQEKKIVTYFFSDVDNLPGNDDEIICELVRIFENENPIDFSISELEVLIILILMRIEEGIYE